MFTSFKNHNFISQNSLLSKTAHWFIVALSIILFIYVINSPREKWDMLGYAASAIDIKVSDVNFIHNYVYEEFEAYANKEDFKELTGNDDYRSAMYKDAEAFYQQIPYYKIRIIFILLILSLTKMGINIFLACHLVSATTTCFGLLAFYYAFKKAIHPLFWLTVPIFFISFNILIVAQTVTADSLAFFWLGIVSCAFMHEKWKTFFFLLVLSILIRTDMILLVALFTGYLMLFRTDLRLFSSICAFFSVGTYFFINNYFENYGWHTLFYFAFVSDMQTTHPVEFLSYKINIEEYLSAIKKTLKLFFSDRAVLLFEICVFIQLIILFLSQTKSNLSIRNNFFTLFNNPVFILTIISACYVIIHYAMFPLLQFRFFVGQYMISALGLLSVISDLIKQYTNTSNNLKEPS